MTVREAVLHMAAELNSVSDAPRFEAEQLAAFALGKRRIMPSEMGGIFPGKYSRGELPDELDALLKRRLGGEPLQYILGEWSFMGLDFYVKPCALIPRQDTETLAEYALNAAKSRGYESALDICTGTGCIAVALKKLGNFKIVAASDISPECVELARLNAERNRAVIALSEADLFCGHGRYDLITANPPYIPTGELAYLQREVKSEPALALDGGGDGLFFYRRIAKEWQSHILPGGAIIMEVGAGQAAEVAAMFGGCRTNVIKDLCGVDRVVEAVYAPGL